MVAAKLSSFLFHQYGTSMSVIPCFTKLTLKRVYLFAHLSLLFISTLLRLKVSSHPMKSLVVLFTLIFEGDFKSFNVHIQLHRLAKGMTNRGMNEALLHLYNGQ